MRLGVASCQGAAIPPQTPQRGLGADGHALAGVPHPPGPGYRRMFGGGRVTTHALLRLGEPASRRTELVSSREKQGRGGKTVTVVRERNDVRKRRRHEREPREADIVGYVE